MDTAADTSTATHLITVTVNEIPVQMKGPKATGLEIKQAAIEEGVEIQLDFVLSVELGPRQTRIIGDADEVVIHPHARFVAVPPDDNSQE
jgi:hypothetical protein